MNKYPQSELFENLADIEHQRWSDWQKYMHSKFEDKVEHSDKGEFVCLSYELFKRWEKQIATNYSELSDKEKDSDRDQVMRYWKLIYPDQLEDNNDTEEIIHNECGKKIEQCVCKNARVSLNKK